MNFPTFITNFPFLPQKKVKISGVKRSQHIKHKKNYARPTKKRDNAAKTQKTNEKTLSLSKKVFGKSTGQKTGKKKEQQPLQNGKHSKSSKMETPKENGQTETEDMNEEDINDLLDMIEDEDDELLNGYSAIKRKHEAAVTEDEAHQFEQEYAHTRNEEKSKKMRTVDLLPIKTKSGELITRTTKVEFKEKIKETADDDDSDEEGEEEAVDSDDDVINDKPSAQDTIDALSNKISTTDLLILREQEINRQKYRIGIICSGILEKPEDKMKNFNALFELMDERINDAINLFTIRKIATMSVLEVFKDILPEYRIGQIDLKTQKGKRNLIFSLK